MAVAAATSKQNLPTSLDLATEQLRQFLAFDFVALLPLRIDQLLQPEHLLDIALDVSLRRFVIAVQIDFAQQQDVLAAHEVCAAWDVAVEIPRRLGCGCRGGSGRGGFGRDGDEISLAGVS